MIVPSLINTGVTEFFNDMSHNRTVKLMKKLAKKGANEPIIQELAYKCSLSIDPIECVFKTAYNAAVAVSYKNQVLRSSTRTLADQKATCANYSTLVSSLLLALEQPVKHYFRLVDTGQPDINGDTGGFSHVYVVTETGKVLDPTLGQPTGNTATFFNRPRNGHYNKEVIYNSKKDFPMYTKVLNGSKALNGCSCNKSKSAINGPCDHLQLGTPEQTACILGQPFTPPDTASSDSLLDTDVSYCDTVFDVGTPAWSLCVLEGTGGTFNPNPTQDSPYGVEDVLDVVDDYVTVSPDGGVVVSAGGDDEDGTDPWFNWTWGSSDDVDGNGSMQAMKIVGGGLLAAGVIYGISKALKS